MKAGAKWILALPALGAATLAGLIAWSWPLGAYLIDGNRLLKSYYIPSESMLPTLQVGDRIIPRALEPGDIRSGAVVLFRVAGDVRVTRIAAVAGDRIAVSNGVLVLNGKPIAQTPAGIGSAGKADPQARRYLDQFPGEAKPHAILDARLTAADNFPELTVPTGHFFTLGDNRDNSADSRFTREEYGVGMVPVGDAFATVDFVAWTSRGARPTPRKIEDLDP